VERLWIMPETASCMEGYLYGQGADVIITMENIF